MSVGDWWPGAVVSLVAGEMPATAEFYASHPVEERVVPASKPSSALERALSPLNIRDGGVFINRAWPTANMLLAQPLAVRAEIARELLSVGDAG